MVDASEFVVVGIAIVITFIVLLKEGHLDRLINGIFKEKTKSP